MQVEKLLECKLRRGGGVVLIRRHFTCVTGWPLWQHVFEQFEEVLFRLLTYALIQKTFSFSNFLDMYTFKSYKM